VEPEVRFLQPALVVQVFIFLVERLKNQGIGLRFPSVLMLCIIAKSKPFSTHDLKQKFIKKIVLTENIAAQAVSNGNCCIPSELSSSLIPCMKLISSFFSWRQIL
jgi:hypothetical protein